MVLSLLIFFSGLLSLILVRNHFLLSLLSLEFFLLSIYFYLSFFFFFFFFDWFLIYNYLINGGCEGGGGWTFLDYLVSWLGLAYLVIKLTFCWW
uniref:NADH dehydrogenase subunit 4L n=1 Tax=Geisha distinctissima TaxID=130583 RepID=C3TX61_9HEMI|nr:NADH dehydrogenase subunit 4L [Geisha distinctissima]ACI28660.1 NADH dehydrogenase subunit 4L [Geisha distinctissima]